MIKRKAIAVIGPAFSSAIRATEAICSGLHVPQIVPWATDPGIFKLDQFPFLLKVSYSKTFASQVVPSIVKPEVVPIVLSPTSHVCH